MDFAGPYTIGTDRLAFGRVTRYITLDGTKCHGETWDEAVANGCEEYKGHNHNLVTDNCHSHVAFCMNRMRYGNRTDWNMVTLALWMFVAGKYPSLQAFAATWAPFTVLLFLVIFFSR